MTRPSLLTTLTLAVLWAVAPPATAQTLDTVSPQTYEPPAHVSFVEGAVTLERDGQIDNEPRNMPLMAGDRLRTRNGRVEILFADGATIHLDANTAVDFQSDELIRLLDGRIRLSIPGPDRGDVYYRVDAAAGWAQITAPGEYRVSLGGDARSPELELAVVRGQAELASEGGQTPLRAGERAFARAGAAPSYAYVFNSASWDSFDAWSEARRSRRATLSVQHLPGEVQRYAPAFDQHGVWRHDADYGYVWYPTVAVDWRPYYHGRWVTMPVYGWTWIGRDPWAWPTHHYGRWGHSHAGWYWIPGRSWAPAWVAWAYAPGYVSWSPLGWNNRPLIQINLFTGRDRWHPWTVVPHRYFGVGYVHARAVRYVNIDVGIRRSFAHRASAPSYAARPRSAAPIRVAGRRTGTAVPRGSRTGDAPLYTNRGTGDRRAGTAATRPDPSARPGPSAGSRPSPARTAPSGPATRAAERPVAVPRGTTPSGSDRMARPQPERSVAPRTQRPEPAAPSARTPAVRRDAAPGAGPSTTRSVPRPTRDAQAAPSTSGAPRAVPRNEGAASPPPPQAQPRYSRPAPAGARPGGGVPAARPAGASAPAARPGGGAPAARPSAPNPARPRGGPAAAPAPRGEPRGGESAGRASGVQRSAPSASRPPASSARPSEGGSNRGSATPGSRSRGGEPSRGAARPRGGGD